VILLSAVSLPLAAGAATEIKVMSSGGFSVAYGSLLPGFESVSGNTAVNARGALDGQHPAGDSQQDSARRTRRLPVYPDKQTSSDPVGMSQTCRVEV
jgi:hypothetical protein